jgi:putative oxidoreductase
MNTRAYPGTHAIPSNIPGVVTTIFPAVGRLMISTLFILSGLSKIAAPAIAIGYIQSVGLPLPPVAFGLAAFTEIVGGTLLLLGYRTRIVAGVLVLFTLATATFFHNHFGDQNQFIHFFKNVAIAGGLLNVMAFGGGRLSLDGHRA